MVRRQGWRLECSDVPRAVEGGLRFMAISATVTDTCAIDTGGVAWCWGTNANAELGRSLTSEQCSFAGTLMPCARQPARVETEARFTSVATENTHSCAIATDGSVYCWGSNWLGASGVRRSAVPLRVPGDQRFVELSGMAHCARTAAGAVWCWGDDAPRSIPFPVPAHALDRGAARCIAGTNGLLACVRVN